MKYQSPSSIIKNLARRVGVYCFEYSVQAAVISLALSRGARGQQAVKDYQRDISLYTRAIIGTLNSLRKNVGMPLITERELEKLPSGRPKTARRSSRKLLSMLHL